MAASELPHQGAGWLHHPPHDDTPVTQPAWLRMHLLGGFWVEVGDHVVDAAAWRLRKAKGLMKLLALAPNHSLHREELMDQLWPDLAPGAAANNLRYTLHIARRAVRTAPDAPAKLLLMHDERVVLCPGGLIWVDVEAFENAAGAARRGADPAAYQAAIDLYAGDLLPEDRYEDWAAARREMLRAAYLGLLVEVAQLQEARNEYREAISAL